MFILNGHIESHIDVHNKSNLNNGLLKHTLKCNTGGPRNSRTFYLRIRLFAVKENLPKFNICEFCIHFPRLYAIFDWFWRKKHKFDPKNKIVTKSWVKKIHDNIWNHLFLFLRECVKLNWGKLLDDLTDIFNKNIILEVINCFLKPKNILYTVNM